MKKTFFLVAILTSAIFAAELSVLNTETGEFKLGKKPYPKGTREKWINDGRALSAAPKLTFSTMKTSSGYADNSAGLPPVGSQKNGDCVHWAGTYAVKTYYMKKKDPAMDITITSGQASPKFTYNLSNAGEDAGGWGHEPFEIFMRYGCPNFSQLPDSTDVYSLPDIDDFVEGLHRRTLDYVWAWDWSPSSTEIEQLKLHLDNGGVASVAVYANSSFNSWGAGDSPWVGSSCGYYDLNHMICVCGYGPGWYKIMNSWGTGWGSNGFMIVDADYFENYFGDCMFPIEGSYSAVTNYTTLQIQHGRRSDIQSMILDVNGTETWNFAPTPEEFPKETGGHYEDTRNDLDIAIDLTFASWNHTTNNIILKVKDSVSGYSGTISSFILKKNIKTFSSNDTPEDVPDNNGQSASVSITSIPEPCSIFSIVFCLMFFYSHRHKNFNI